MRTAIIALMLVTIATAASAQEYSAPATAWQGPMSSQMKDDTPKPIDPAQEPPGPACAHLAYNAGDIIDFQAKCEGKKPPETKGIPSVIHALPPIGIPPVIHPAPPAQHAN